LEAVDSEEKIGENIKKKRLLTLLLVLFFPISIFAETVVLKSGKTIEGKLIETTDKCIRINAQGFLLTYSWDEVESIDRRPANILKNSIIVEILNPRYAKPPNIKDNIEINSKSTVKEILKKTNYYYSIHNFDKAIELGEMALKKTNDKKLITAINFSLSSNYLEKGKEVYGRDGDNSFYKLSIQFSRKVLEEMPYSWQALSNIGTVYFNTKNWELAIFYLSEAEKYLNKNDPNYVAIVAGRNIAERMINK